MWFDESGFKHNGPSPYQQRKLATMQANKTIEEKYQEKVEEVCRWLNNLLYLDPNTRNIRVLNPDYHCKKEIIDDFRKIMLEYENRY